MEGETMRRDLFRFALVVVVGLLVAMVCAIANLDYRKIMRIEKPVVQSGLWLQPSQIVTNTETHEFQFMFKTDVQNMGALVVSRFPGDPTWYFEAHHNARIWTCQLNSKIWKDCRVLLLHEP